MTTTTNQARQRFITLPSRLQDAVFSPQTAEVIDIIATQNHISDEKAMKIADVAGWVLLGFLHIEDVTKELQQALGLPQPAAAQIAASLDAKLFGPLKSDLESVYAPLPHPHEEAAVAGPKIIEEIRPAPRVTLQAVSAAAVPPAPTPPPAPAKPNLSASGWSRTTIDQPVVKLNQTPPSPFAPKPGASVPAPMMSANAPVGEFERLAAMHGGAPKPQISAPTISAKPVSSMAPGAAPAAPAAPVTPKPAEPLPVIIHEDAVFKTQQRSPDFRFPVANERIDMQKPAGPAAAKPAVLEFGRATPPPAPKSSVSSTPRVVHYTEYQPPASGAPSRAPGLTPSTSPQGPRQITEVTAPPPPPPKL